ncbi:MAG: response regulator [Bacteroidota bacterium]
MRKKLNCILLVDDDHEDNFYHEIIIKKMDITHSIQVARNGIEALDFLKKENQIIPELIFLDVNMPKMNGWEFLDEYKHLSPHQKAKITIVMLTTSANPDDIKKAEEIADVNGYRSKPLSVEMLTEILNTHFQDYL